MEENGVKGSKIVARLKANMDRLLTTVLVGTNFLNSLVSALATAFVVKIFGGGGVGLPTLVTAFFITTFGQIIPKTLAGINPEKIACFTALALSILEKIFFPIIWLFEKLSHSVIYIVEKIIKPRENLVTEEELKTLIEVGEKEGTIEKDESKMLNKIITFNNLNVSDIMRHRSLVSSLEINSDYNTVIEEYKKTGYSNIIIYLKRGQVRQALLALITINPERSNPFRAYQHQWFINAIATKRLQSASAPKDKCGIPKNAHRSIERIVHSYSRTPAKAGINKSFGGSSSSEVHQYSCPNE